MRRQISQNGLTVNAIAGVYVVFFGLDLAEDKHDGFLGFGFKRYDHVEDETTWLRGTKTFEKTEPHPAAGETFSTQYHPIQSFQWADYSVKPGRDYTYTIVALYGAPDNLERRIEIECAVKTEVETGPTHSAFFNRGSAATQEYARRFLNQPPNKAGQGAYDWLSRGLIEAIVAFLGRAEAGWSVRGAVYEFQLPEALAAVKAASKRGADVKILYDDIESYDKKGKPDGPFDANRKAIAKAGIKKLCIGRTNGTLMHNKFFVLSKDGVPQSVLTGSTNLTENGVYGHSNLAHIVEDKAVAQTYLDYWDMLRQDPEVDNDYRSKIIAATPAPPAPWDSATTAVFSPRYRKDLDSLEWYVKLAEGAGNGLFMTFAFGMHKKFKAVYSKEDSVLRMALLEKEGNPKTLAQDKKDILAIRKRPNVVLAVGNRIATNSFDRWLAEMCKIIPEVNVYWIHTKYMLIDPLGESPLLVTGSANFSEASTHTNDENMLVIRGDKRIADIYFGEFMRLYSHYAFREAVKRHTEKSKQNTPDTWKPQYLFEDASWIKPYYDAADTSGRFLRRKYFAGPMAI
jgi:phosphatidylserine/phosphatidylglycerophosphate/cardiolipin synthase-like enzyme